MLRNWREYASARGVILRTGEDSGAEGQRFILLDRDGEIAVTATHTGGDIPCQTVQAWLDDFLRRHGDAGIDYIHGEDSLRKLAGKEKTSGILLPEIDKGHFFEDVRRLGVLPRKTFSMGEAHEKRYYMEAREIL